MQIWKKHIYVYGLQVFIHLHNLRYITHTEVLWSSIKQNCPKWWKNQVKHEITKYVLRGDLVINICEKEVNFNLKFLNEINLWFENVGENVCSAKFKGMKKSPKTWEKLRDWEKIMKKQRIKLCPNCNANSTNEDWFDKKKSPWVKEN